MPLLELFSGIGGAGLAWGGPIAGAIDQSAHANRAWAAHHGREAIVRNLASVKAPFLAAFGADRWWMSPPCQPFTARGARRDLDDPRTAALLRVLDIIAEVRPPTVAMENVPDFVVSATRGHLRSVLIAAGYTLHERLMCPTALGIPMRRARYYLTATLLGNSAHTTAFGPCTARNVRPIADFLDESADPATYTDEATVRSGGYSAHILAADDPTAIANCFTSAYGRSPVRAGSYLRDGVGVRLFSPEEILRLMGFPATWSFPGDTPRRTRWELVGNSLSVDAVRSVLTDAGVSAPIRLLAPAVQQPGPA